MSLYICQQCGAVENTALGAYHGNRLEKKPVICSECDTGEWHGRFPKEQYDPEKHDQYGHVIGSEAWKRGAA